MFIIKGYFDCTGIANVSAAPFTQVGNTLLFSKTSAVSVYNASGAMLYSGKVTKYTLPSTSGMYIIRTHVGAYKVMNNN